VNQLRLHPTCSRSTASHLPGSEREVDLPFDLFLDQFLQRVDCFCEHGYRRGFNEESDLRARKRSMAHLRVGGWRDLQRLVSG
jgi:hypothetical protein